MRLHRCLLIACVTLSQACDSKEAAPTAAPVVTKAAQVVIDDAGVRGTPIEGDAVELTIDGKRRSNDVFDVLLAAPKLVRVGLTVDGVHVQVRFDKTAPDGPGMQAHLLRTDEMVLSSTSGTEGTGDKPLLVTKLDEPGKNALRAALADIKARTKATRIDAVVDRVQPMSALVDFVVTLQSAQLDVRLVAGAPTTGTALGITVDGPPNISLLAGDHEQLLLRCFEQALRREGPMNGLTIELSIVLDKTGVVRESKIGGSEDMSTDFVNCMTKAVLAGKISAPAGAYQFIIHFKAQ